MDVRTEEALRQVIMNRLAEVTEKNGGVISREELTAFPLGDAGTRRLIDQSRGIWNPKDLNATLTILSSRDGPYEDREIEGGLLRYDYRAGSAAGDNAKLRRALELQLPLILLRKVAAGVFLPVFPVYVVADDVANRQFVVALDESLRFFADPLSPTEPQRRYAEQIVRKRLHQPEFRVHVIRAYATRCAVCLLRHADLLDAAHIVSDRDELGQPVVPNGLSMCKIHHAAYDHDLLGISPDLVIHINADLLAEVDGPMLQHGLKEMHGRAITVPARRADRPDPVRLDVRFHRFRAAG